MQAALFYPKATLKDVIESQVLVWCPREERFVHKDRFTKAKRDQRVNDPESVNAVKSGAIWSNSEYFNDSWKLLLKDFPKDKWKKVDFRKCRTPDHGLDATQRRLIDDTVERLWISILCNFCQAKLRRMDVLDMAGRLIANEALEGWQQDRLGEVIAKFSRLRLFWCDPRNILAPETPMLTTNMPLGMEEDMWARIQAYHSMIKDYAGD